MKPYVVIINSYNNVCGCNGKQENISVIRQTFKLKI